MNTATANADSEEKFQSICIILPLPVYSHSLMHRLCPSDHQCHTLLCCLHSGCPSLVPRWELMPRKYFLACKVIIAPAAIVPPHALCVVQDQVENGLDTHRSNHNRQNKTQSNRITHFKLDFPNAHNPTTPPPQWLANNLAAKPLSPNMQSNSQWPWERNPAAT